VKAILLIGFFLSVSAVQAQVTIEPVEPELEVEIRSPVPKFNPVDPIPINVIGGPCKLTERQKDIAWKNVIEALAETYPEHLKYCEVKPTTYARTLVIVNGICRANVACVKTVDGVDILHGDFTVEVDETTQEVRGFIDVAW
jgi:hypothetical protein